MADTSKLNDWLGIATNIGVIVGLFFLAYELTQTNEELVREKAVFEVENLRMAGDHVLPTRLAILSDEELSEIWMKGLSGQPQSEVAQFRFDGLAELTIRNYRTQHDAWERVGPGRGRWAVDDLSFRLAKYPGLRSSFSRFLEYEHEEGEVAPFFLAVEETLNIE